MDIQTMPPQDFLACLMLAVVLAILTGGMAWIAYEAASEVWEFAKAHSRRLDHK